MRADFCKKTAMGALVCVGCLLAAPVGRVSAQPNATPAQFAKPAGRAGGTASPQGGAYVGDCGDYFRCYTGIPLRCGDNTRPWQNIAKHACFCVHDGCPQQ